LTFKVKLEKCQLERNPIVLERPTFEHPTTHNFNIKLGTGMQKYKEHSHDDHLNEALLKKEEVLPACAARRATCRCACF
jgi:hypothetical protein